MQNYIWFILLISCLFSMSQEPTYLVLNHFDQEIPEAEKSLIKSFNNSKFEFNESIKNIFLDLDDFDNPASSHMDIIKELGAEHKVNFILLNKIEHNDDRFVLDGLLFNTRSVSYTHLTLPTKRIV